MAETDTIRDDLERLIGAQAMGAERSSYEIDGLVPPVVVRPDTEGSIARVLEYASGAGLAVAPWGRGSRQHWGDPLARCDIVLSLERYAGVIEHDEDNLTITVRAGTSMADLQAAAARAKQFAPLSPPMSDQTTAGGLIATNVVGPDQRAYGTCRDQLLGVRTALASGELVTSGGKTMKNVAGYDVTKLLVGSFGTLAVITEATFKTLPLPEGSASIRALFDDSGAVQEFVSKLLALPLLPTSIDVSSGECTRDKSGWNVLVGFDGSLVAVDRELRETDDLLRQHGADRIEVLRDEQHALVRQSVRDYATTAVNYSALAILKITVPIALVIKATVAAETLAKSLGFRSGSLSHAGSGVIRLYLWSDATHEVAEGRLRDLVPTLRASIAKLRGWLMIERAALSVRKAVTCFGLSGGAVTVMRRIKERLDPKDILNRGRLKLPTEPAAHRSAATR